MGPPVAAEGRKTLEIPMARFLTSLVSLGAIATLGLALPASACPRDGHCGCKHMAMKKGHKAKLHETKTAAKASGAQAPAVHAVPAKTTDLSPRPHVRMLEPLAAPVQHKLPEEARLDASAGVLI